MGDANMKISWVKYAKDSKHFQLPETLGYPVLELEDMEAIDEKLKELIKQGYQTIIVTDEVASFSEDIIKKYPYQKGMNIIIVPR